MNNPRLLLVDDVPANLQALVVLLRDRYELQFATNGQDALALLKGNPKPDLILLDVMMPVMDGYAVCREIRRHSAMRHIPVMFVTALDDPHDEVQGLELGAADYITKPFAPEVVLARIRNQLRQTFTPAPLRPPTPGQLQASQALASFECYVEAHLHAPLRIGDIETQLGLSARTLQYACLKKHGCSPTAYIRHQRLDYAYAVLREQGGAIKLSEMAQQLHFSSQSQFSRYFRERFGVLPSQLVAD